VGLFGRETSVTQNVELITVLVVEDDPGDVLMIKEALESLSAPRRIHVVNDGREAWDCLRRQGIYADVPRPDLILLDLNMPRMDGRELLALIKTDEGLRTIPVVVFTTSAAEDDVTAAYARHANAYVTKPVDLEGFSEAVARIDDFFAGVASRPGPAHAS
jgi:CheY-like chemotaxis protein